MYAYATRGNTECRYGFLFRKAGQEFTDDTYIGAAEDAYYEKAAE